MPDVLQWGPFTIRWDMLVLILSGLAGYYAMALRLKRSEFKDSPIINWLFNAFIIFIVFWKFGYVFSVPSILWKDPLKLLLLQGSSTEILIGAAAVIVYFFFQLNRNRSLTWVLLDLVPYGALAFLAIQNLLLWQYGNLTTVPWGISASDPNYHYHPINVYLLILIIPAILRLWTSSCVLGQGKALCSFLIFYGLGWLAVSLFQPQEAVLLILSIEQIVYILMAAAGTVISYFLVKLRKNIAY